MASSCASVTNIAQIYQLINHQNCFFLAPAPFTFGGGSYVEYQIKESYRRQQQLDKAKGSSLRRRRRETEQVQTVQMAFRTGGASAGGLLLYVASQADFTVIQVT